MKNLIVIIPTITANTGGGDGLVMLAIMLTFIVLGVLMIIAGYLFREDNEDSFLILFGSVSVISSLLIILAVFIVAFIYSLIS